MSSVMKIKVEHPREWLNLVLAVVLFVSPWVLDLGAGATMAAWTLWATGAVVAVFALIALLVEAARPADAVSLILGIWTIAAPWIAGFATLTTALWTCTAVGILLALIAAWEVITDVPRKEALS